MPLLKVEDLKVYYPIRSGFFRTVKDYVRAVNGISFAIKEGETYGLVGESGCGKTTTGRTIIGLNKATSGHVYLQDGEQQVDLLNLKRSEFRKYRSDLQMIFQDPYSSLNPKKRVKDIILEPLRNFEHLTPNEEEERIVEALEKVGLGRDSVYKYPHQFSGGQRQRIGIARSLVINPRLIIADEPVSALDVSVQAQVLNFMKEIQKEFNLSYLFISHDLGIIRHMCDRIGIMYNGRLVEEGTTEDIFNNPQHLYTKRLLSAIPNIDPQKRLENKKFRDRIEEDFKKNFRTFFDENGRIYDLKPISETHSVAIP